MPETTRSGFCCMTSMTPCKTVWAGVPPMEKTVHSWPSTWTRCSWMIPSDVFGKLRPVPEDCSRGAVTVTNPSFERAAAAAHNPGERIPSSLVNKICGRDFDIKLHFLQTKRSGEPLPEGALGRTRTADLLLRKQAL